MNADDADGYPIAAQAGGNGEVSTRNGLDNALPRMEMTQELSTMFWTVRSFVLPFLVRRADEDHRAGLKAIWKEALPLHYFPGLPTARGERPDLSEAEPRSPPPKTSDPPKLTLSL